MLIDIVMTETPPPAKESLQYCNHEVAIRVPEQRHKPWPRNLHCRGRYHKEFLQWYAANKAKFAIELELIKRTDRTLEIGFRGILPVVTAQAFPDEIAVSVDWDGTNWDVILWIETYPKRVPGGYVCSACPEDKRSVFASREDLWRFEVFEPFLAWINDDLAKADSVSLSGTPHRMTWARLVKAKIDTECAAQE